MGAGGDLALDHRRVQGLHRIRQVVLGVASLPGDRPDRPIAEWESRRTPTSMVGGRPSPSLVVSRSVRADRRLAQFGPGM
jgi:hypothetical protein